jgi:hypothetical protein
VADLLRGHVPELPLDDAIPLIRAAYEAAERRGKEDWEVMSTAVLKNRLLLQTKNAFDEARYGAPTMAAFISGFPQLIKSDTRGRSTYAILVDAATASSTTDPRRGSPVQDELLQRDSHSTPIRIRKDLWDSVVDYVSAEEYVWDNMHHCARPVQVDDSPSLLRLPTLSPAQDRDIRGEFVRGQASLSEQANRAAARWAEDALPTTALPYALRNLWRPFFRQFVLKQLRAFFSENAISEPDDLIQEPTARPTLKGRPVSQSFRDTRTLLHAYIDSLSEEELGAFPIPAARVIALI